MRTFSSAEAKNHFGELIDAVRLAPAAVTKYDRPFIVLLSIEDFERLESKGSAKESAPTAHSAVGLRAKV